MAKLTLDHAIFSRLTYEEDYEWWAGQVELRPGFPIDFSLSTWTGTAPKVETDELIRRGVDFLNWARSAQPMVQQRIADDLLDCYNDTWASENEGGPGQMSREQFLKRIATNSIDFHADESAYWYFGDGGLFAGHTIEVRVHVDRTISEVLLAG